jgi:SAM-dependent methyltransferase
MGIDYKTHAFDRNELSSVKDEPGVEPSLTVADFIDAAHNVLKPGGILAMDTDDYLLPHLIDYLEAHWSHRCYRTFTVTLLTQDGEPDRSTPGMYGSTGGYEIVIAQKAASVLPEFHPVNAGHPYGCPCERERRQWGWGTVKTLAPYEVLVDAYTTEDSRVIIPCAGTAPALIAAERAYGGDCDATAIDIEPEAREAYKRRRDEQLSRQAGLSEWG